MVLESLSNIYNPKRKVITLFAHGMLYALAGLLIGLYFFPTYASLITTFFVAAASIPLLNDLRKHHQGVQESDYAGIYRVLGASFAIFFGASLLLTIVYAGVPGAYAENAFRFDLDNAGMLWNGTGLQQTLEELATVFFLLLLSDLPILFICIFFAFMGYDDPASAERLPLAVLLRAAASTVFALLIGLMFFREHASMVIIFLATAANIPLLFNLIKYEEDKDWHEVVERILIYEHSKAIIAYLLVFAAITLTLTIAYLIFPSDLLSSAFSAQMQTYQSINPHAQITGQVTGTAGEFFSRIFTNNLGVLAYCVLFSFLYGAGAVFILTWNASVIAFAAGNLIRQQVAELGAATGIQSLVNYVGISSHTLFLRYGIHGFLEILAYMLAGLAGGIISVAVIKHHTRSKQFEHIIIDSATLLILAIMVLFFAAVVETWITPIFY